MEELVETSVCLTNTTGLESWQAGVFMSRRLCKVYGTDRI